MTKETKVRWSYETGTGKTRVVVSADPRRGNMLTLRWWDRERENWKRETLGRVAEMDRRGRITDDCEQFAISAANTKSLELLAPPLRRETPERKPLTIGEAEALITNPEKGRYPHDNQNRDEVIRALRLATAIWGADTPWSSIEEDDWTKLLRKRLEKLLADKRQGVRATEITIARLITAAKWLRKKKHITREAAPWPDDWKKEIADHWKGVTGSLRDPESASPRHTLEEGRRILRASNFDPRFELLMWLGMELRLGQVARARRTDLELTLGNWSDWETLTPEERERADYGTFTVYGAGKKGGTVVALTAGQRRHVDAALAGYLKDFEERFQLGAITDYLLFPAGYVSGRVALTRGKESSLRLGKKIDLDTPVSGSWLRKNFQVAEARAGIEHQRGRGAYGLRRQGVDTGDGMKLTPAGLQALGGWKDTKIPQEIYRERGNRAGQLEARATRARLRGEE